MNHKIDLTNRVFGRLTVIEESGRSKHGVILWLCQCTCGLKKVVYGDSLKRGTAKSCGCIGREIKIKRNIIHGHAKRNGISPEFTTWNGIIVRCYYPSSKSYPRYGGRGIRMCDRWRMSFLNFFNDMGAKPAKNYSIERKDNDGHYSCGKCVECLKNNWGMNCKWATIKEQSENKKSNRWLEFNGERMLLRDWAKKFKVDQTNVAYLLKKRAFAKVYNHYMKRLI